MRDWNWLRPHTLNLYQYTFNDPVNHWDPNGFGVIGINLKISGKNNVSVHPDSILDTLGTNYLSSGPKKGMRDNGPNILGKKNGPYHKTYLINIVAQLETGDNPKDFKITQSGIASSEDGIVNNLNGKDSPIEGNIAHNPKDNTLSMVDVPGFNGYNDDGQGVDTILSDDYVGVFQTDVTEKSNGKGKSIYWQVIINVDSVGKATYEAIKIEKDEFEMYRDGFIDPATYKKDLPKKEKGDK